MNITPTDKLIDTIKQIANDVFKTLGSGHSECIYCEAMQVEFRLRGIGYERERTVEVTYRGHYIGTGLADLVVRCAEDDDYRNAIAIELKVLKDEITLLEEQQLRIYMRGLEVKKGLVINFASPSRAKSKQQLAYVPQIVQVWL